MPDVQTIRGGAPTKSEILVNADQLTILGDGSLEDPLHATGGSVPTTEHLSGTVAFPTAMDESVDTSFIQNTGADESTASFTLANGTVDGQIHNIVNESSAPAKDVSVTPGALHGGSTITSASDNASAVLIWNEEGGEWHILGTMLGFSLS